MYLFFNWAEYSALTAFGTVAIQGKFPLYIFIQDMRPSQFVGTSIFFLNYPLLIFLSATIVNSIFIFKLQRSRETKPNSG
jgi:hypothetical protein